MLKTVHSSVHEVLARVRNSAATHVWGECRQLTCAAMSTSVRIVIYTPMAALAADFQDFAIDWIANFEARYSRFLPDSIVGRINASAGGDWVEFDQEADELFDICDRMHQIAGGVFDPAALPMLRLWNWK